MKIAFVVGSFPLLSETFIVDQIVGLIKAGHQIQIYSLPEYSITRVHHLVTEYNLISKTSYKPRVPKNKFLRVLKAVALLMMNLQDLKYLLRALNFFKIGKKAIDLSAFYEAIPFLIVKNFDVVHCHFGPNGNRALLVRELGLLKGKFITTFHGADTNLQFMNARPDMYNTLFKVCDLVTVNSAFTCSNVVKLGCKPDKIQILPMGVDPNRFSNIEVRRESETLNVLSVARLIELKGIEYGIRAVSILVNEFKILNVHYSIIGDGPLMNSLKELVHSLKVETFVSLLGAKTHIEVVEIMKQTDIFLMPGIVDKDGRSEAQGLVIQEAQAMEIPVVVSEVGGMPEGLVDGITGYLVPPKKPEVVAAKIKGMIGNPESLREMGQEGRKFVLNKYNQEVLNQKLAELYHE